MRMTRVVSEDDQGVVSEDDQGGQLLEYLVL